MKMKINPYLAAVMIMAAGCVTVSETLLSRVENITRGVTQAGAIAALTAKPAEARTYLSAILNSLDASIASGAITASQLGSVVQALDLDPNAIRWSTAGFLVYDSLSMFWANATTDKVLYAAAQGMSAALSTALLTTPVIYETAEARVRRAPAGPPVPFQMPRKNWSATTPEPTSKNTKRI